MSKGIFGSMFDFNRDGKLNAAEQAAEFMFLQSLTEEECDDAGDDVDFFDDDDEDDLDTDLMLAGLDKDELMRMDEEERREALEDAGLDPYDYDDLDF